ncbi:MAG: bifunctional histidinol-phosphatase/imidazoleglycerol-phosphate dehydratase HisB [Bacteroidetes bacterium]|nr:bifunctional histidinol-phosphatase/imidazoleglycerol-phosphate dehydratase HisB [Bacteroidota bacterium]
MKKKALFIDRDGTIIVEPPTDFQVDSLEKLEFIPGAIGALRQLRELTDYEFVMVTNQDGLGTDSFPEETFWPAHNKMLKILEGESITFDEILIDRSFPHEGLPTRKPGIGLMGNYLTDAYDLANSYVIGDRRTDVQLAQNLGAKAIFIGTENDADAVLTTSSWKEITAHLLLPLREASIVRNTRETQIELTLTLDEQGKSDIKTGLHFFDHMLDQLARHSGISIYLRTKGDLEVDEHHTIEDTALALGEAFAKVLFDKRGMERYGFSLVMDDALAQVALDFGGRPWLVWEAVFKREKVGDMPTEMFYHFFKSFADAARCNLNIKCEGENEHHKIEAIFKGLARSIRMAVKRDVNSLQLLPSTKGML